MFITTATKDDSRQLTSCSVFDTVTGIKYMLQIDDHSLFMPTLKVEIYSAHTTLNEDQYPGVSYRDNEALDFWRKFVDYLGEGDILANDALHVAIKVISDREFKPQDTTNVIPLPLNEVPF